MSKKPLVFILLSLPILASCNGPFFNKTTTPSTTSSQNFYNPAWTNPADYPSLRKTPNTISQTLKGKTPAYKFNAPAPEEKTDTKAPEKK